MKLDILNEISNFLRGKKTYLIGGIGLAVVAGYMFGAIDYETMVTVLNALGFGGLVTLRMAIEK